MHIAQLITPVVVFFVLAVAIYDLRERRIPNVLVFPAMLVGTGFHLLAGVEGRLAGVKGVAAGFLLLLIPYAVGGMKAGDVKFLMAIGALLGWEKTVATLLAALLFYPVMAIFYVVRERKARLTWLRFRRVFWNFAGLFIPAARLYSLPLELEDQPEISSVRTPFGVSLAVGALIVVVFGHQTGALSIFQLSG
jgi:prepilin peptidase CpaA